MNKTKSGLLTTALLFLVAGLCYVLLATENTPRVQAQEGAKGGPTILCSSYLGPGRLILVDDENRNISVYKMNEKGLKLYCNRNYTADLNIEDSSTKASMFWTDKGTLEYVSKINSGTVK